MKIVARFERSQGLLETLHERGISFDYKDPSTFSREIEMDTADGPWVQLTYGSLRDSRGEIVATLTKRGEWVLGDDPHPYSDVVISVE